VEDELFLFFGHEIDDAVGDDAVCYAVFESNPCDLRLDEFDVLLAGGNFQFLGFPKHFLCMLEGKVNDFLWALTETHLVHVYANHFALWTNFIGGKEYVKPSTAAKVNDSLSL
jgi:hypothetical protein